MGRAGTSCPLAGPLTRGPATFVLQLSRAEDQGGISSILLRINRTPGRPWPWFPPLPGSGPEPSRQRRTGAGRKAAGSLPLSWECRAGQAHHQLWGPRSIISAGWGCVRRLLWADTPSQESVDPLLLLPLAPTAPLGSVLRVLGAGGRGSVTPLATSACPRFFLRWL